jgi:hypothetical protein
MISIFSQHPADGVILRENQSMSQDRLNLSSKILDVLNAPRFSFTITVDFRISSEPPFSHRIRTKTLNCIEIVVESRELETTDLLVRIDDALAIKHQLSTSLCINKTGTC